MIIVRLKEHNFIFNYFFIVICLLGVPFQFSWQCGRCKTWEWGSIYRFIRQAYNELIRNKCIKHRSINGK